MPQGMSDKFLQAEARTEGTKQFVRDIKRLTNIEKLPPSFFLLLRQPEIHLLTSKSAIY